MTIATTASTATAGVNTLVHRVESARDTLDQLREGRRWDTRTLGDTDNWDCSTPAESTESSKR